MKQPKRYIKFTGKKCVMRPFENEEGITETWETVDSLTNNKEFFIHENQKYKLTSSTEKKNKK